jgi:hypothetical protein
MLAQGNIWGEKQADPAEQEAEMRRIAESLPPLHERKPKVYLDFAWQGGMGLRSYRRFHPLKGVILSGSRRAVNKKLRDREFVYCQPRPMPRGEMWRRRGEYAFVLSPHGVGLDCHRTWEALALGHIVLVPTSALAPLYEGLPVVQLRSWEEINLENLISWRSRYTANPSNVDKLTSRFWVKHMRSVGEQKFASKKDMSNVERQNASR